MADETRISWFAETLKAIRNPMVFNAFAIAVMALLVYFGSEREFSWFRAIFLGAGVVFVAGVAIWLNWFASTNPRFLAYGPDEYLRESELDHERKMKAG